MVSELREQTGAGMMECKKALVEAEGDVEKARDLLRAKGVKTAENRAGRAAADGVISIAKSPDAVAMVELNSETDFVARNPEFRALAEQVAEAHAAHPGESVSELLEAKLADGRTIKAAIDEVLSRMRENLVLRRSVRFGLSPDSVVADYVHAVDGKTGVLVELKGDPSNPAHVEAARQIAMHAAFTKPKYLVRSEVPAEVVEREKAVLVELTRNEGKPEAAIEKIVEGRIGKFFEGICLAEQPFVRDQSKKIAQVATEVGAELRRFAVFVVGQE
jgi:elongation factor Ts